MMKKLTLCFMLMAVAVLVKAQDVSAFFNVNSEWNTGISGEIRLTNNTSSTINGWSVLVDLDGNIDQVWNAEAQFSVSGKTFTALSWNQNIAPGATVSFGFNLTKGSNYSLPTSLLVNGQSYDLASNQLKFHFMATPNEGDTIAYRPSPAYRYACTITNAQSVSDMKFIFNGVEVQGYAKVSNSYIADYQYPAPGVYSLQVRATANGVTQTSAPITYVVEDFNAIEIDFLLPKEGDSYELYSAAYPFAATVTNREWVEDMVFYLNGVEYQGARKLSNSFMTITSITTPGFYTLEAAVLDENGFEIARDEVHFTVSSNSNQVNVFPNPADTYFDLTINKQVYSLVLINTQTGQQTYLGNANAGTTTFDVSNIPAGHYQLQINAADYGIVLKSLIIN